MKFSAIVFIVEGVANRKEPVTFSAGFLLMTIIFQRKLIASLLSPKVA